MIANARFVTQFVSSQDSGLCSCGKNPVWQAAPQRWKASPNGRFGPIAFDSFLGKLRELDPPLV